MLVIESWNWLQNIHLKREMESIITSAKDLCIGTNNIKTMIDFIRNNPKCRLCKAHNKTITHIISECPKLLQKK